MKISLIHPSRGRPKKAQETADRWLMRAGVDFNSKFSVGHILSLDKSDAQVKNYYPFLGGIVIESENQSVVEATNKAAEKSTGDILIYLSDDFDCPDNWAELVIKEFEDATGPRLIKVDDMLQPFHVKVLTIPIMNRTLYEMLGYFWHPSYKSMFVDEDLYHTAAKLGALKFCPHLKFEHKHVSVGKAEDDETYRRSSANWKQGEAVFNERKRMGFPV